MKVFKNIKMTRLTELLILELHNQLQASQLKQAISELMGELNEEDITECEKVAQSLVFND